MANNNKYTSTSTQIRTFYSETSCLTIKFFNTNLSFHFHPSLGLQPDGRYKYDTNNTSITTVEFGGAFALYKAASDIINENVTDLMLEIDCSKDAKLKLQRSNNETVFSIDKNGVTVSFKFATTQIQETVNGVMQVKQIETGLGAFMKTIEGYLTGINADRHLDKLTEEYMKLREQQNKSKDSQNNYKPYNKFTVPNKSTSTTTPQNFNSYKLPN